MTVTAPDYPSRKKANAATLGVVAVTGFGGLDLVAVRLLEASQSLPLISVPLISVIVGVVLAQYGLLAIWAALGSRPWYVRQAVAIIGVVISYGALAPGGRAGAMKDFLREAPLLPLTFLCLQTPLWLLRLVRGWKIISIGSPDGNSITDARRFSLRQVFAAITVIAIAIALARIDHKVERGVSIMVGAVVIGLILVAPCASSALASRSVTTGTFWILAYAVVSPIVLAFLIAFIAGAPEGIALISLEAFSMATLGSMHGILVAVRRMGFVLHRACK